MPEPADRGWISAPQAAALLGLSLRTTRALIDAGELEAEVTPATVRPRPNLRVRIRRAAVDEFVERARVKPGELRHLYRGQ